jgi:hypothetical protein
VLLGFAAALWANAVLALAGGLYPVLGVGRFIPYMGYVGSIAFIPPVLARGLMYARDRMHRQPDK